MKKKEILLLVLFLFIFIHHNSFSRARSNYKILDSLILLATQDICDDLISIGSNKAILNFQKHSATWLVKQGMLRSAERKKLHFFIKGNDNKLPVIEISINECFIEYQIIKNSNDSLKRVFNLNIYGIINKTNGKIQTLKSNEYKFEDIISREDLAYINDTDYAFLNPKVPKKTRSFFEKITEPIIVVASAVLVVILFFTVRSG